MPSKESDRFTILPMSGTVEAKHMRPNLGQRGSAARSADANRPPASSDTMRATETAITPPSDRAKPSRLKGNKRHLRRHIQAAILAEDGELTGRALAAELGRTYLRLTREGKHLFLRILAEQFDIDPTLLDERISALQHAKDAQARVEAELALRKAETPPRVKLLKHFNTLPDGFKFLIDMRADLLGMEDRKEPGFRKLDADLKDLLASWFDIGLLDLHEITWNSPAALLEKLIQYEAVHEIRSWRDLKNRLLSIGRCFGYFHNKVPDEPLIFVEVALVIGLSSNIQRLLSVDAPSVLQEDADTAIFYSISSTQDGLTGIRLGNFLIKRVVDQLSTEMPNLKHFATLSPVPHFRRWLENLDLDDKTSPTLSSREAERICSLAGADNPMAGLLKILDLEWHTNKALCEVLRIPLLRLCAHYLLYARHGNRAFDGVAHFHLSNGARLERLNWLGDTSEKGLTQSAGIMVNYYYRLNDVARNHEQYVTKLKVATSREARSWLKRYS